MCEEKRVRVQTSAKLAERQCDCFSKAVRKSKKVEEAATSAHTLSGARHWTAQDSLEAMRHQEDEKEAEEEEAE